MPECQYCGAITPAAEPSWREEVRAVAANLDREAKFTHDSDPCVSDRITIEAARLRRILEDTDA